MSSKKPQGGDERFRRVQKDPRFWEMPEREHKIKIDKRFQSMFHDKRFTEKYTVDKRGRPINQTSTEDLKRFYKLSDSEEEEGEVKGKKSAEGKKKKKGKLVKEKLVKGKLVTEKLVKEKLVKEKLVTEKLVTEKLVTADGEAKRGQAVQRGDAGGQRPERGVRVVEEKDEEEEEEEEEDEDEDKQRTAEEDDVDLGDSVTDDSDDEEDDDDDAEDESGSEEEGESGLDSDSDSEPDLARGKGNVETSSDEDDEDSDVDALLRQEEAEIEHDWGELAKDAKRSDEVSARLAVCNMDWDRIKAKDLLALINSFVPKEGAVLSVKVFPSEFGKERLNAEQTKGPLELKALPDDSEDDNEEERGYREKMRDYQFKRLKYYYAVVECDSADTAAKVYQECDGYEYESSCSVLDLRFIPDDVQFDGEEPKDVATDVNLSAYEPKLFTSSANATSKVQLTWDETDNDRVTALSRKFNKDELLAMDFNAYLASSSEEEEGDGGFVFGEQESEDDDDEDDDAEAERPEEPAVEEKPQKKKKEEKKKRSEEQISKYRELLKGIRVKEKKLHEDKDMEMEITWVPGLKETTEQLVKKKLEGADKATPWEEFLQKKKDKKKQKKSQRKEGEDEDEEELSDEDLPPDVDLSDPFFAEELAATDTKKKPKWKKKKKKHEEEERTAEEEEELEKQKAEMALLMEDEGDEADHKHFNYDQIVERQNLSKQKRKKLLKKGDAPAEGDDFQVDVKDPRFQAMFTSHLFNLDPSNPNYKKTKATQSFLAEKQRRRGRKEEEEERRRTEGGGEQEQEVAGRKRENDSSAPADEGTSKKSMDPGLSLLIKSIKSKTEQFQARKKQKLV